jgi:hypothetical protein
MAGYTIPSKIRIREKGPFQEPTIAKTIVFSASNQAVMKKVNFLLMFSISTLLIIK